MSNLQNLLSEGTRPAVVAELSELAETTVANQSGLTGMALKSALAAVKKTNADAVSKGVDRFLPQIVSALEPHWEGYKNARGANFGDYLAAHEEEVVQGFLNAADNATDSMPAAVQRLYSSMRGRAAKIVGPALPGVGSTVEKHAA